MAPSILFVTALFAVSHADLDESSMLQMPIVDQHLAEDECRCPGYYEAQCTAEVAQGCVWSAQGSSNGPWCQCLNTDTRDAVDPATLTLPPAGQATSLWSQHTEDHAKCNDNVHWQYVESQADCQAVAVAAGHPYYSFRHNGESSGHKCMSSATCDNYMIALTNEWNIYVAPAHSTPSLVVFDEADSALTVAPGSVTGSGQLGWNTPANSAREITASDSICGVSFKCNSAATHLMIGMASQPITGWGDFDYGITCRGAWSNNVDTFENGHRRHREENRPANGNPTTDVHAVRVNQGGQVEYSINGAVYYTSSRAVTYPWHVGLDTYTAPSLSDVEYIQC